MDLSTLSEKELCDMIDEALEEEAKIAFEAFIAHHLETIGEFKYSSWEELPSAIKNCWIEAMRALMLSQSIN